MSGWVQLTSGTWVFVSRCAYGWRFRTAVEGSEVWGYFRSRSAAIEVAEETF